MKMGSRQKRIDVKKKSRRKGIEARSSRRKRQQFAKTHILLPLDLQTGAKLEECADYKELDGGANAGRQCVCVRRFWQKLLKPWRKVTTTTVPTPQTDICRKMLLEKRLFRPWPTNEQQRTDGEDGRSCWWFAKWSQAHPASLNLSNCEFFSCSLDSKATFGQFSLGWKVSFNCLSAEGDGCDVF